MNAVTSQILACAASYLAGAIPFGLLFARAKGIDIRAVGSGNIGATNVFRSVSKTLGIITFACDAIKGFVSSFFFPGLAAAISGTDPSPFAPIFCAVAAVAGHNWPVYLRFKGGKGVATTAGALLGIAPLAVGIGLGVWIVVFISTRYVSVGSIVTALVVAAVSWPIYIKDGYLIPVTLTILCLLGVLRHAGNIKRLIQGTENRFEFRKKSPEAQGQ